MIFNIKKQFIVILFLLIPLTGCDDYDSGGLYLNTEQIDTYTIYNNTSFSMDFFYLSTSKYISDTEDYFDLKLVFRKFYNFTQSNKQFYNLAQYKVTLAPGEEKEIQIQTGIQPETACTIYYNNQYKAFSLHDIRNEMDFLYIEVTDELF